jgi:putative membrane protein insertion efficiency factor
MARFLRILLRVYKATLSPFLAALTGGPGTGCRFRPTCSEYLVEAVEVHGWIAGSWMGIKRIFRCHPWGTFGYDPVPARHPKGNKAF